MLKPSPEGEGFNPTQTWDNKEGLELLQEAVKDALSNSEAIILKDSDERINMGILLREREHYNIPIKETLKDSILEKVFISLAFCWFVILPFLAIFLIYDNINSNDYSFEYSELSCELCEVTNCPESKYIYPDCDPFPKGYKKALKD